ncbi:cytochrome c oxidase subunit II [Bradyrhizobium sp. USDA 10063]
MIAAFGAARHLNLVPAGAAACVLAACDGVQSSLAPQGPEAERVLLLFSVLAIGGGIILLAVIALVTMALFASGARAWLATEKLIIGGGIVFPIATLTAVLGYSLVATRAASNPAVIGEPLRISVIGEQWWWRVIYADAGRRVESANELRIPVGRPVEIELSSADVIHSLWVPKLAGKLDMIPGRKTVLNLAATTPGVSRGQCAEYCGGAHAFMSFYVVALPKAEFESWLDRQAAPARAPVDADQRAGQLLLLSHGCGSCHTIRGTSAVGTIGPDLTHVGSRMSLAAGALSNDAAAIARWITDNQHVKPQNRMPPFGIFTEKELTWLSSYLAELK